LQTKGTIIWQEGEGYQQRYINVHVGGIHNVFIGARVKKEKEII